MRAAFTIANRDFKGFFGTSVGWIAACIIFLVAGIVFYGITIQLLEKSQAVDAVSDILLNIVGFLNYINIFVVPIFTMRVMSEELNTGTFRLQAAAPISSWDIVFGKFLGIMYYFGAIALFMLIYPLYVFIFAEPDFKVLLSGWLGFLLIIGLFVSIGIFVSSLTKNAVISYLGTISAILFLLLGALIGDAPLWYRRASNFLDLGTEFSKGIINTTSFAVFLPLIGAFLFLSHLVVESKRWRV